MKTMIETGDGSWQKRLDDNRCPKCWAELNWVTNQTRKCKSCHLTITEHGERCVMPEVRKQDAGVRQPLSKWDGSPI